MGLIVVGLQCVQYRLRIDMIEFFLVLVLVDVTVTVTVITLVMRYVIIRASIPAGVRVPDTAVTFLFLFDRLLLFIERSLPHWGSFLFDRLLRFIERSLAHWGSFLTLLWSFGVDILRNCH